MLTLQKYYVGPSAQNLVIKAEGILEYNGVLKRIAIRMVLHLANHMIGVQDGILHLLPGPEVA